MRIFQKAKRIFYRCRAYSPALMALIALLMTVLCTLVIADEPVIRVARVSLIDGDVSYQRANDSRRDWFDATINLPLDQSDQLYSGPNGRAEIQLSGRNIVRIDHDTNLRFTAFNTGTIQLALPVGTATFRIDSLDRRQFHVVDANDVGVDDPVYFEVDTPVVAVTLLKEGLYRINVRDDGFTEVIVRRGQAEVYHKDLGTITVKQGRRILIEGNDPGFFQITRLDDKDDWDRWNDRRDDQLFSRADGYRSSRYVPASIPGVYDLDIYGDWYEAPGYGWVWTPRGTPVGWAPFRQGYWRWYPAYGWTWISYEPWGWAPYHYGRWAWYGSRWCWVPTVGFGVGIGSGWRWSPHLVAFFGWGGGYGRGYRDGFNDGYRSGSRDGWFGWCPLAPGEQHYGRRGSAGNSPRSIESLRNYNAPGGVSGMESRRFDQNRVLVTNDVLTSPSRGGPRGSQSAAPVLVQTDEIKPTQTTPARTALIERAEVARRIEAPVVARRTVDEAKAPARTIDRSTPAPSRAVPDGSAAPAGSSPTRIVDGQIVRPERPSRAPEYREVERAAPPDRRAREGREATGERDQPAREIRTPPREYPSPSRGSDPPVRTERPSRSESPARIESEQRRSEPPPRATIERRESPPPRESAPPRTIERGSTAPPRQSAPPAPAKESAPARSTDRPAPTRKPDS